MSLVANPGQRQNRALTVGRHVIDNLAALGMVLPDAGRAAVKRKRSSSGRARRVDGTKTTSRGGNTSIKSRKTVSKPKKTLRKSVREIQRELKSDMSYKYVRRIDGYRAIVDIGKSACYAKQVLDSPVIVSDIANLKIGTGTPIDVTATMPTIVTENTQISITGVYCKITTTNTNVEPVFVDSYVVKSKTNTSIAPDTAYKAIMVDMGFSSATGTDTNQCDLPVYPALLPDWNKQWNIVSHSKAKLRAGDSVTVTAKIPDFKWSQDYFNDHPALTYLKKMNMVHMLRLSGDICYDGGGSQRVSTMQGVVHTLVELFYTIEYSGTTAAREYRYVDGLDTGAFTGTPTTGGPNVINIT